MKNSLRSNVSILREKFEKSIGLPFANILKESEIEETLKEEGLQYRKRLFCPIVTLWAWLSQVLDKDKSCKKAVSRVVAYLVSSKKSAPSTNTGAYCKARKRIRENWLLRLVRKVGNHLHQDEKTQRRWCGRRVAIVDGSTLLMSDTEKNQKEYPQHKNQKKGCGFPIARIVALFSLSTGAVLDAAISSLKIGEVNLFRQLYSHLKAGDVALGDRIFGSYSDICSLLQQGVDSVFRMHGQRKTDFRKGKRLGRLDHIVKWQKPKQCPKGLSLELFDSIPQSILLREVRFLVQQTGFRTKKVTLVTTLLDCDLYPKASLAELYRLRWQAEIELRHLKMRMQMEFLNSKTPKMVRKDFYVHLLAYNLIRTVQWEAGQQHQVSPISLSFSATIQHFTTFIGLMVSATYEPEKHLYTLCLVLVATEKLPFRPNRVEPRVVKRRPKPYPWMKKTRNDYQRQYNARCA